MHYLKKPILCCMAVAAACGLMLAKKAHASITVPDMGSLMGTELRIPEIYPSFTQSRLTLVDTKTRQNALSTMARCGYDLTFGGGANHNQAITEWVLHNPISNYVAVFQKIDGNDLAIIRDNENLDVWHISGVVDGVYKGKSCSYDDSTGLVSNCVGERPKLPETLLHKYVDDGRKVCESDIDTASQLGAFKEPPPRNNSATELYIDTMRRNWDTLAK